MRGARLRRGGVDERRDRGAGTGAELDAHIVLQRGCFGLDARIHAAPGEIVALMGPSGAGKSTLLAVIAGLLRASGGHVRVGGSEVSSPTLQVPPQRRGVVSLGQDPHLFPHLSARENVAFALRGSGTREDVRSHADAWLERVGLAELGARRPAALSGGQQQRVALARALAARPRVLLLDEPLSALDPVTAADLRVMLAAELATTRTTALIVTHAVVDAVALAARLVLLEDGRVSQAGSPREVLAAPDTAFGAVIAGVSRVPGTVEGGMWRSGRLTLPAPDLPDGEAIASIPASVVRLQAATESAPTSGVAWRARVERVEATPTGARLHVAEPAVAIDVPAAEFAELVLTPGEEFSVVVDPRNVRLTPPVARARA